MAPALVRALPAMRTHDRASAVRLVSLLAIASKVQPKQESFVMDYGLLQNVVPGKPCLLMDIIFFLSRGPGNSTIRGK